MRFVDTNIFLRLLTNDDPAKADACESLFLKAVDGGEALFTTDMVIAEIVWVLESYYGLPKADIREKIESILNTRNLNCPGKDLILQSLAAYDEKNIDFVDAYNASILRMNGIEEVYSYDKHYDRLKWVKRIEPGG